MEKINHYDCPCQLAGQYAIENAEIKAKIVKTSLK
jgi:hypothetical protein